MWPWILWWAPVEWLLKESDSKICSWQVTHLEVHLNIPCWMGEMKLSFVGGTSARTRRFLRLWGHLNGIIGSSIRECTTRQNCQEHSQKHHACNLPISSLWLPKIDKDSTSMVLLRTEMISIFNTLYIYMFLPGVHTYPLPVNPAGQMHLRSPLSTPQKAFWSHATSEQL